MVYRWVLCVFCDESAASLSAARTTSPRGGRVAGARALCAVRGGGGDTRGEWGGGVLKHCLLLVMAHWLERRSSQSGEQHR
jgi:hypothetical protein